MALVIPTNLSELSIDTDKDWNAKKITNLGAPTASSDAARKTEVDTVQTNLDTHAALPASVHDIDLHGGKALYVGEEYYNHLGNVDNFLTSAVSGNGTITEDAANHRSKIDTGAAAIGYAIYRTKKAFPIIDDPLVINILIRNIINGAGGNKETWFGLKNNFTNINPVHCAAVHQKTDNSWEVITGNAVSSEATVLTSVNSGDLFSILITATEIKYYSNTVLKATHTAYIPTNAGYVGAAVHCTSVDVGAARSIDIDMLNIKRYGLPA